MADVSTGTVRARLLEERDRIRHQLDQLGLGSDRSLAFDDGFADSSQVTAERGEIEALAGSLSDTLIDVEGALGKLERGDYGRCESCESEIGDARLEAMPIARLCIRCASNAR